MAAMRAVAGWIAAAELIVHKPTSQGLEIKPRTHFSS
jgi:hypothetical protein